MWTIGSVGLLVCLAMPGAAGAQEAPVSAPSPSGRPGDTPRESLADAWWTGSLLAPTASAFPQGHTLVEPYVYDAITTGRYDDGGTHRPAPNEHNLGSFTYVTYAVTDRIALGLLPSFGYNEPAGAPGGSSPGVGDFGAQVQYSLTSFYEGSLLPETAVLVGESFPTGRYDRLQRATDGLGSGSYTTSLAWYSQDYLWMPNGRIMRVRLDLTYTISSTVRVQGASIYGTATGFRGRARPGDGASVAAAAEYSLTRNWVLATDLIWSHSASTRVAGSDPGSSGVLVNIESGSSEYFAIAPAVEFNWSPRMGVIVGARIFVAGRNTPASITPVTAINMVFSC